MLKAFFESGLLPGQHTLAETHYRIAQGTAGATLQTSLPRSGSSQISHWQAGVFWCVVLGLCCVLLAGRPGTTCMYVQCHRGCQLPKVMCMYISQHIRLSCFLSNCHNSDGAEPRTAVLSSGHWGPRGEGGLDVSTIKAAAGSPGRDGAPTLWRARRWPATR